MGSPTAVSHSSWVVFGDGGLGVVIRGGGSGGASCGGGVMETQVSPFSCSSMVIERGLRGVLLVELLFCDACIFEIFVGVPDFVVFSRMLGGSFGVRNSDS